MLQNVFGDSEDSQVWSAFKKGDQTAYDYMYSQYFYQLYNYGRHITRNEAIVEDCIQELFIYLLKHRENLADVLSIKYYLFRALRRRIHQAVSQEGKNAPQNDLPEEYNFEVTSPYEQAIIEEEQEQSRRQALLSGIQHLPKRQKEALFLIFYEGLPYKEVASIMSLEVKTIYNFVHNAISLLRKHVGKISLLFLICCC